MKPIVFDTPTNRCTEVSRDMFRCRFRAGHPGGHDYTTPQPPLSRPNPARALFARVALAAFLVLVCCAAWRWWL